MITNEQREARKLGIGGSDMPIILGLSPYKTPYQLYLEKIGKTELSNDDSQVLRLGNALEAHLRDEFALKNDLIIETPDTLIHPFHEFLRANVDGYIPSLNAIWEGKTTTYKKSDEWRNEIPLRHKVQLAHYCAVANADSAYISVFFAIDDIRELHFERNLELEGFVIDAAITFWNCVQAHTPPEPVNIDDLRLMFPHHEPEKAVVAKPAITEQLNTLLDTRFKIKALSEIEDKYKFNIMQFMQDAECLVDDSGKPIVTWRANKRGSRTFLMK